MFRREYAADDIATAGQFIAQPDRERIAKFLTENNFGVEHL